MDDDLNAEVVRLARRSFHRYWHFGWKEPELHILAEVPGGVFYSYCDLVLAYDICKGKAMVVGRGQ